jgi:hypothetical protein
VVSFNIYNMIIDKEVKIKMNSKHISKYRDLGYVCEVGELSIIKIEDLPKYSKCELNVRCDDCNIENRVIYINYTKQKEKYGKYRCYECGRSQIKKTLFEKYGVDNPTKLKIFSQKISNSYNEKTEDEKIELLIKTKKGMFEKYGGWYTSTDEYKEKLIKHNLENYGVSDYRSTDEFKNKVKNTLIKKYGVEHASHVPLKFKKSWFGNKINGFHEKSNLSYQGTYELDFLEKYYDRLKIEKINPIQYFLNENSHYYHPDFYLPEYNLIIEVKSSYTYNYDLDKNLAKKEYSIKGGYNFIFIIDKDYNELNSILGI